MIDESYCNQVGTEKQHRFACSLASSLGYESLRHAIASTGLCSVSKCGHKTFTIQDASFIIDQLKLRKKVEQSKKAASKEGEKISQETLDNTDEKV